ncbi:saposin A [Tieghemostelium lacteum]|uniref:Pulmonary surfactant-associated protein B n=1 Tax=Tieghemostelium lacteum TaxID=361077 RepID=A0A152A2I4_TIELA|nr:saposin A [Tieghemostelium lacteum]|eukprot:KYR00463.1 saposin A [Tieghemostelium lacteum]
MKSILIALLAFILIANVSAQGITCSLCEFVVKIGEDAVNNNKTQTQILADLEIGCKILPGKLAGDCDTLVSEYGSLVINMLINQEAPQQVCSSLKLCTSKKALVRVSGSYLECEFCDFIVDKVEQYIAGNSTQSQILAFLDKDCTYLKATTFVETCQTLVNQYAPIVIQAVEQKEPASVVCSQINVCSSSDDSSAQEVEEPVFGESADPVECELCLYLAGYVDTFVKNNQSLNDVENFLTTQCSRLSAKWSTECVNLVDAYVPEIFTLATDFTPEQICQKINLCAPSSSEPAPKDQLLGSSVEPSPSCDLCEIVYTFAEDVLSNNVTDQQALQLLEADCKVFALPSFVKGCQNFVQTEGEDLITFIQANPNATTGCVDLGFCQIATSSGFTSFSSSTFTASSSASSASSSASSSAAASSSASSSAASSASSSASSSAASSTSQSGVTSAPPPDATGTGSSQTTGQTSSTTSQFKFRF